MLNQIMQQLGLQEGDQFLIKSAIGGLHTDHYRIESGMLLNDDNMCVDHHFIKICSGEFKVITAKDVCKRIGVEIGEEFMLKEINTKYKITKSGEVQYWFDFKEQWVESTKLSLFDCYIGAEQFSLLPFEPMSGEIYYTYLSDNFLVEYLCWGDVASDYCRKASGCVFRTREEAYKARPAKFKELTGRDFSSIK